jgi:hypothetical protein
MVKKTVHDLLDKFYSQIKIIIQDNNSKGVTTISILKELDNIDNVNVQYYKDNSPRRILRSEEFGEVRKNKFILTDPDLDLSKLPNDTIDFFINLTTITNINKIGTALELPGEDSIDKMNKIEDIELKYWEDKVLIKEYENIPIYNAYIDTTFALYDFKSTDPIMIETPTLRVAGSYIVRHLPWHKSYIDNIDEIYFNEYYNSPDHNGISSNRNLIISYRNK